MLSRIVTNLTPTSKKCMSDTLRRKLHDTRGRPTISNEKKEQLVSFLERPDICGREESGEKIYRSKHYLLWPIRVGSYVQ